jgi:hypothetical protein
MRLKQKNPGKDTPSVIEELNENLQKIATIDMKDFTVERIAEGIGISKNLLYEWCKGDAEFSEALERLRDVQKNDPFRTGTEEDTYVNSMMISLLLFEKRDRHYKSGSI